MKLAVKNQFIIIGILFLTVSGIHIQRLIDIPRIPAAYNNAAWADSYKSDSSLPEPAIPKFLTLVQAAMCEGIKELVPQNPSVIFSVSAGKAFCFSSFDPVPEKTSIYHSWYRMDKLVTKIKLTLNIPAWSTYSNIQLRETDIGPWRVEISDAKGNILEVLRFSITE